jgi:fluoride exporter
MQIFLLALFGVLGTLSRYGLQGWVQEVSAATFPTGTLAVNLLGCLLMGGLNRLALEHLWFPPEWRIAVMIGFLGAFTTFSTFGFETFRMLEDGEWARATLYVSISLIGGLLAVVAGTKLVELI